tara:strand:- start:44 stop:967 length:924 start_codon:yes stop_codon:yes gene_type:complete
MLSVLFPGQGSQSVGMCKEFYDNFEYVKNLFKEADDILKINITKMILEGPKENLNLTENTQPAIFLTSYSIFKVLNQESNLDLSKAKFYAGHSLGEYSALACAGSLTFQETLELLKARGQAMQNAVPKGKGGMMAVLGETIDSINNIIDTNSTKFQCFVANDNSPGQQVLSAFQEDIEKLSKILDEKKIKYIILPVSAPFHCPLMKSASEIMQYKIQKTHFKDPNINIVSNVTATSTINSGEIKKLLVQQIEKPVRWRESILNIINNGVKEFVEIGPGKVLSGLVKRIDRNIKTHQINSLSDLEKKF